MTVIFGHRGARGLYPENTIEGFLYAAGLGIYGIEMDVVISHDRKVVVSHEPWMNPKTCTKPDNSKVSFVRRKNLFRMDYSAIRRYDCGMRGHPDFPEQKKIPVYKPLLVEVISAVEAFCKQNNLPPVVYNIELKSSWVGDGDLSPLPDEFVDLVLRQILPFNINDRILLQSFDMRPLNILHKKNTGCMIGMLVRSPRFLKRRLNSLEFIPDTCGIFYKYATERWVKHIQSLGMKIFVWTENEKEDMRKHIEMGIDGIITDYPARAVEVMKEAAK